MTFHCVRATSYALGKVLPALPLYAFHPLEEQGSGPAHLDQEIPVSLAALDLAWQMQHQDALRLTHGCATTWGGNARALQQAETYFQQGWEMAQREQLLILLFK